MERRRERKTVEVKKRKLRKKGNGKMKRREGGGTPNIMAGLI